jgi:hypothetical protein
MALVMVHSDKGPNSEARAFNAPEPKVTPREGRIFVDGGGRPWTPSQCAYRIQRRRQWEQLTQTRRW